MLLSRWKAIAATSTSLLVGILGVLAFAQRPNEAAPPAQTQPPPGPGIPEVRPGTPLLQARIQTARQILDEDMKRMQHQGLAPGSMGEFLGENHTWSVRLMEDQSRLAATPAGRLGAIREHRGRMDFLARLSAEYARSGQGRMSDALKGRYYLLEADQLLADAGGDPAREPAAAAPPANAAPPPAPPPPPTPGPR